MREASYTQDLGFAHEGTPIKSQNSAWTLESSCVVVHSRNERELVPGRTVCPSWPGDHLTSRREWPTLNTNLGWQPRCCTRSLPLRLGCAEPHSLAAGHPQPPHCIARASGQPPPSTSNHSTCPTSPVSKSTGGSAHLNILYVLFSCKKSIY